jgi:hypothetical protein
LLPETPLCRRLQQFPARVAEAITVAASDSSDKCAIDAAWAAQNWENGCLGYPARNEITGLRNGGVDQNF